LATARANAIAAAIVDSACAICGESYPAAHLLRPTTANEVTVCPTCVFDDDLWMEAFPQRLAYEIDRLIQKDLAIPARWTAVAAVLAYAAGPTTRTPLKQAELWAHSLERASSAHWADPGTMWIWLPPTNRPAALSDLGPGASLRAVAAAVEAAHPDLRDRFRSWFEAELDTPSPQDSGCLVEELWPAAIAYAATFATDRIERRGHYLPVVNLFDCIQERSLTDHFAHLRSTLIEDRTMDALITLEFGAQVVATALGWGTDKAS
jgi:hypothetical protein